MQAGYTPQSSATAALCIIIECTNIRCELMQATRHQEIGRTKGSEFSISNVPSLGGCVQHAAGCSCSVLAYLYLSAAPPAPAPAAAAECSIGNILKDNFMLNNHKTHFRVLILPAVCKEAENC